MRRPVALVAMLWLALVVSAAAEEWFDAYQRGQEALSRNDAPLAVEHFQRATRLRPEPGSNLFTYGTNRLAAYHPWLKLTEARLLAGDVGGARTALAESNRRGREPRVERLRLSALVEAAERAQAAPPPSTTAPSVAAEQPAAVPKPTPLPTAAETVPESVRIPTSVPAQSPPSTVAAAATPPLVAARVERSSHPPSLPSAAPSPSSSSEPAKSATLVVFTTPPGALVYLDDEPLGATDPATGRLVKTELTPGRHRLRAGKSGWHDLSVELSLKTDGDNTARLVLPEREGLAGPRVLLLAGLAAGAAVFFLLRRRRAAASPQQAETGPGHTVRPAATRARPRSGPRAPTPASLAPFDESFPTRPRSAGQAGAMPMEPFGEYRLLELLGRGGMAQVYRAERGGEQFALKRPLASFLDESEFVERFAREAEIGRTLHHPCIVRIFERGEAERVPYFTMELVEGETLQARLRRGPLGPRAATEIVCRVAEALDYAHLKGVVHRDLKPSNVMLAKDGGVKVMDYGIARARRFEGLTATGAFLGTPEYAAPEAAEGRDCDARSDLYSLGVAFYEMLTGRRPFTGETAYATIRMHCTEAPTPPSTLVPHLPRRLEAAVLRLMEKQPQSRFANAEDLLVELRDYLVRADRTG